MYINTYSMSLIKPIINPRIIPIKIINISPDFYLGSSILIETISTTFLKKVTTNKIWFIPVYTGYALSFYLFPKSLQKYSLNSAYTLWSGFGILFTLVIDLLFYKEIITLKKFLGIISVITGIYLSK